MELRGQEKNISMPSSMGFNPPQPNQDPSFNLSSPPIISSLADDKSKNEVYGSSILSPTQTLDHHLLHQHQNHLFNQPQAPPPPPPPPRDQNPDPDPDPDPTQIPSSTIAGSSNCKAPQAQPQPKSQPQPQPHQPVSQAQEIASSAHSSTLILYRECLKNHAASTGGHVLDGCGEFMPSGEEGTPGALKCAACECHRNFHRRETDGESQSGANCHKKLCNPIRTDSHRQRITINPIQHPPSHPAPPPHHHYNHHHRQKYSHGLISSPSTGPVMMAFGSGGGGAPAESSSEDLHNFQSNAGAQPGVQPSFLESKKRFRTKFSKEQKDKMHYFADKLGWKMQNQDEQELEHFCNEVGVKRQVFKVWMHNNKQAMKKKEL